MSRPKYRFTIEDVCGHRVCGFANTLHSIKRIIKHFDFTEEVIIKNTKTSNIIIWKK